MRLLVLGGTSWLGGLVARDAEERGHEVTCLARGESGPAPQGVRLVRADRERPDAYRDVVGRAWDAVVEVSRQPGQVRAAIAALRGSAAHWTLVSTGSVYADQSGPLSESSPTVPAAESDVVTPEQYGEGKVACEDAVRDLPHHHVVRAGLIGGPGDRSDRLGYYVARFASAGDGPVLTPAVRDQPLQVVDARDLARWIVTSAERRRHGVVHGVGEPTTVGALIDASADASGFTGQQVSAPPDWLHAHDVEPWMGERSLPLWLPAAHHGMGRMDDTRALQGGLERRPLRETLADTLADERARGLDRDRGAGLSPAAEHELLALLR